MENYRNTLIPAEKLDRFIGACSQTITRSMFQIVAKNPESGAHHGSILHCETCAKNISFQLSNLSSFLHKFCILFSLLLPWLRFFVAALQMISVFRRFLKVTPCLYSPCLEWFPLSTRMRPYTNVSGQPQIPRKSLLAQLCLEQVRFSCPVFSQYSVPPVLHLHTFLLIST